MNIAFDMSFTLSKSGNRTGAQFAKRLVRAVGKERPNCRCHFFYPDRAPDALPLQMQLERFLSERQIDIYQILCPYDMIHSPLSKAWFGKTKVAVLLQDLFPKIFFDTAQVYDDIHARHAAVLEFVKNCDLLIAHSEASKEETIRTLGAAPQSVKVVPGSAGKQFRHVPVDRAELDKYGIVKKFVVAIADVPDEHHLPAFVQAFGIMNAANDRCFQLVMIGKTSEAGKAAILHAAAAVDTLSDIVWIRHLRDSSLMKLYNGAELFIYPSFYEGSGMQVLDAMACGTPVLTFDQAAGSSASGDAAYRVHPGNFADLQQALTRCLLDKELRSGLRSKGYDRTDPYDWQGTASKVLDAYQYVLRRKLAIFAPLAPLQTEIADYVNLILPSLHEHYDCDLFIDKGYTPSLPPELEGTVTNHIFHHRDFRTKEGQYDEVVFQFGNTPYHAYMVPYLLQTGGIVVLHDLRTDRLTRAWSGGEGAKRAYVLDDYLKKAKVVIVHSRFAKSYLNRHGYRNVGLIRLPQKLPVMISLIMHRDFVFSSFGPVDKDRHLETALRCLKKLYAAGNKNIRYVIVGRGTPEYWNELKALIRRLGLTAIVELKPDTDKREYQTRLSHSDVCIQLSDTADGGASGALLDVMSHGKAAIVSNRHAHAELPNEAVCKIRHDGRLEERLYTAMQRLYKNKELRKQMRQHSRKYVAENHRVSIYADRFKGIVEDGLYDEVKGAFEEGQGNAGQNVPAAEADGRIRTVYLRPNRYRRILQDGMPAAYFSFNLSELPQGCTIQKAVMHIQAVTKQLLVYRIRSSWSGKSASNPSVRQYPFYKKTASNATKLPADKLFALDCTQLAQSWRDGPSNNHGVYVPRVSAAKMPRLQVVIQEQG